VRINSINAVTLKSADMRRAVAFYRALGFNVVYGGEDAAFTSLSFGSGFINLTRRGPASEKGSWVRIIFHVENVDDCYAFLTAQGFHPEFEPRDAPWGERYFHLIDPDGHELSFAKRLG
jgi:catechol 2,3-dioxygenase-like lactoylglutathione lyase family enzyme